MTLRVAFLWSFIFVSLVFVGAVKSRPVKDDICHILKRGECGCQCHEERTTMWRSLADLYKRLFVRTFVPEGLEMECSKCIVECKRHIKTNCLNGNCVGKDCACSACWKGKSCNQPANAHPPKFVKDSYKAKISADAEPGLLVTTIKAIDEDSKRCTKDAACPCGDVIYSISSGNEADLFTIDMKTGELRVLKSVQSHSGGLFEMAVTAQNTDGKQNAVVDVFVTVKKKRERRSAEHRIVRRSTPQASPSGMIVVAPVVTNNSFYKPGDKITFNLTASHNQSIATAKPTDNLNFKCSSPYLSVNDGSLTGSGLSNKAYTNGELGFTIASLPKATVANAQFEATVKANMHPLANLYFSCEAVGTTSGVSYKIGPVASTPPVYGVFPKVTFTRITSPGVSLFDVDTTLHYRMTIDMPKLNFPLLVELTSAINDFSFMAVFDAKVTQTGSNIGTGDGGNLNPTPTYHKSTSDQAFFDRATLDFKNLTVSAESDVNNKIVIEWKVNVSDHPQVANGSKYWNGAGLSSGSNMLHVTQQAFYTKKIQPALTCTLTPQNNTVLNRFSIDDILIFDTECSHLNTSTANAKNIVLQYYSTYLEFLSSSFALSAGGGPVASSNHNVTALNNIAIPTLNQGEIKLSA